MRRALLIITALLLVTPVAASNHDNEFYIDEYKFEWKVFSEGDLVMNIVKTEETNNVQLWSGDSFSRSYLRLSPNEAVKIAIALEQTRAFFNQHKGTDTDVVDRTQAGGYQITFRTSVKYGFSVTISNPALFSMVTFSLNRSQAIKLQPVLMQAPEMVEFINEKLSLE